MSKLALLVLGVVFTLCLFAVVAHLENFHLKQKRKMLHRFDEDGLCDLNEKGQPRD